MRELSAIFTKTNMSSNSCGFFRAWTCNFNCLDDRSWRRGFDFFCLNKKPKPLTLSKILAQDHASSPYTIGSFMTLFEKKNYPPSVVQRCTLHTMLTTGILRIIDTHNAKQCNIFERVCCCSVRLCLIDSASCELWCVKNRTPFDSNRTAHRQIYLGKMCASHHFIQPHSSCANTMEVQLHSR